MCQANMVLNSQGLTFYEHEGQNTYGPISKLLNLREQNQNWPNLEGIQCISVYKLFDINLTTHDYLSYGDFAQTKFIKIVVWLSKWEKRISESKRFEIIRLWGSTSREESPRHIYIYCILSYLTVDTM